MDGDSVRSCIVTAISLYLGNVILAHAPTKYRIYGCVISVDIVTYLLYVHMHIGVGFKSLRQVHVENEEGKISINSRQRISDHGPIGKVTVME